MPTAQQQRQQQPDQATIAALVVILVSGQPPAVMSDLAAKLLAPFGIGAQALGAVLELLVPHLNEGGGFALPPIPGAPARSARGWQRRTSFARHADYLWRAARRVANGGSLEAERRYLAQHLAAERARREGADRVDAMADRYGTTLGWYAQMDGRTTPACREANGKNFLSYQPPAIGLPGTLHGGSCRCKPGPPHRGGTMLAQTARPGMAMV